ncbi:MAG: hypothetical protein JNM56_22010 [Planctomycetia bacterium]|nr:hypothetical protein [Planctomycetia bacterium]
MGYAIFQWMVGDGKPEDKQGEKNRNAMNAGDWLAAGSQNLLNTNPMKQIASADFARFSDFAGKS